MDQTKEQQKETSSTGRRIDDWLRDKRTNPYYVFVSALFAVILGRLGQWVYEIAARLSGSGVSVPPRWDQVHLVGRLSKTGEFTAQLTTSINRTDDMTLWLSCLVAFVLFFYVIHLWLYFSRVFIYIEETPFGETVSFFLGFSVLLTVCAIPNSLLCWPLLLALPTVFVFLKSVQVRCHLKNIKGHPIADLAIGWWRWSLVYAAGLAGMQVPIAILSLVREAKRADIATILMWIFITGLFLAFSFRVFYSFRKIEEKVKLAMTLHIEQDLVQEKPRQTSDA